MEYVNFVIVKVKKFMSAIGEDKNEMNLNTEYLDLWDKPASLTEAEIKWFSGICNDCIEATGIKILIECADHEKLKGKSKEALGIFYTNNIENPLDGDCKITIDIFFIHECYEEVFNNGLNLNFEDLEHVIAHEFAHAFQWRHCKRHTQLTEELYQKIKEYQKTKQRR